MIIVHACMHACDGGSVAHLCKRMRRCKRTSTGSTVGKRHWYIFRVPQHICMYVQLFPLAAIFYVAVSWLRSVLEAVRRAVIRAFTLPRPASALRGARREAQT